MGELEQSRKVTFRLGPADPLASYRRPDRRHHVAADRSGHLAETLAAG
jgi:hypothetical protein